MDSEQPLDERTPVLARWRSVWRRELRRDVLRRLFALAALVGAIIPLLTSKPVPLDSQPFPDSQAYADMAFQIANGNGFLTRIDERLPADQQPTSGHLNPSRYPPGLSLVLAPFVRFGDNELSDTQTGARFIAVLLLLAIFAASAALGGPTAAGIAALVTWMSPFVKKSSRLVMSDAFGALLTVAILAVLAVAWSPKTRERAREAWAVLAGMFAGYGVLARLGALFILVALLASVGRWRIRKFVALGTAPFLIFLGTYQWTQFGHPLKTGYSYYLPTLVAFDLGNITKENLFGEHGNIYNDKLDGRLMEWTSPCDDCGSPMGKASNLVFYPALLLGLYWIYFPPLFSVLGGWELFRRRRTVAARFGGLVVIANLLIALAYFYQGGRLVAPAALVLLVYSAAGVARLVDTRFRRRSSQTSAEAA